MSKEREFSWYEHRQIQETLWNGLLYARCFYCKRKIYKMGRKPRGNIDHIIPRAKGGNNSLKNLVLSCVECNTYKADKGVLRVVFWASVKKEIKK